MSRTRSFVAGVYFAAVFLLLNSSKVLAQLEKALHAPNPTGMVSSDVQFEVFFPKAPTEGGVFKATLIEDSLQWTRIEEGILVPRLGVRIEPRGGESLEVIHRGVRTRISASEKRGGTFLVIPGFTEQAKVVVERKTGESFTFWVRPIGKTAIVDFTCSPYGVKLSPKAKGLFLAHCQRVIAKDQEGPTSLLRVDVLNISEAKEDLTQVSLTSDGPKAETEQFELEAQISRAFYRFNFGMGLGPYTYQFESPDSKVDTKTLLPTLYGSLYIDESVRLVSFAAFPIHQDYYFDAGLYLNYESFRALDRRVSFNLLIGGHVLNFPFRNERKTSPGFPQGVELIGYDLLAKSWNTHLGAFYYPDINNEAYKNIWARVSRRGYFVEFNFLMWKELIGTDVVSAKNIGLCFGMPLFRI